jgi:hypothetical protein
MAGVRSNIRIQPDFVDIQETLKRQIGKQSDDDYLGAQSGVGNTIGASAGMGSGGSGGAITNANGIPRLDQTLKKNSVSIDYYDLTFDTRLLQSANLQVGQLIFDPSAYLKNQNILDFSLNNVIDMSILGPFFIPKLAVNESFIYERILMVVKEAVPSSTATSGVVAPQYHFAFKISDAGVGKFELTPIQERYVFRKPIRFEKSITLQFYTPQSAGSTINIPPFSIPVTYAATAAFTTTFANLANAGFVVGDVVVFDTLDQGIKNNTANADFFRIQGHTIVATVPLAVTISGAYTILDAFNVPVPVGTPFLAFPASRVIRVPFRFRVAREGDGNFIVPV